jgi:hypothetical protein
MKKIKFIMPLIVIFLFLTTKTVFADAYIIHLYYNNTTKVLSFDKFAVESVFLDKNLDPPIIDFVEKSETSSGSYIAAFYDATGNEIISTQFNTSNGAFQLTIPYFGIGNLLKIYETSTKKELLTADLSAFATCNSNGICEYEKGETIQTCLGDCDIEKPLFSPQTLQKIKENNGIVEDNATGVILLKDSSLTTSSSQTTTASPQKTPYTTFIYIIFAIIIVAFAGWFGYKKFTKEQ